MKAEADATQANTFRQLEQMNAMFHRIVSRLAAPGASGDARAGGRATSGTSGDVDAAPAGDRARKAVLRREGHLRRGRRGGRRAGRRGERRGGIATAACGQLLVHSGATGTGRFSGAGSAAASAADAAPPPPRPTDYTNTSIP